MTVGVKLASDWLRGWYNFFRPITERMETKVITTDIQLNVKPTLFEFFNRTIMEAVKTLKTCPRLNDPASAKPESLEDWLELLSLSEYYDVFQHNGFTYMERIHRLWEVELTSVSDVDSY